MALSENIRNKRMECELEQQELAQRAGVSKTAMNFYELGTKVPSVATLISIADALHCSLDELVGRKIS